MFTLLHLLQLGFSRLHNERASIEREEASSREFACRRIALASGAHALLSHVANFPPNIFARLQSTLPFTLLEFVRACQEEEEGGGGGGHAGGGGLGAVDGGGGGALHFFPSFDGVQSEGQ